MSAQIQTFHHRLILIVSSPSENSYPLMQIYRGLFYGKPYWTKVVEISLFKSRFFIQVEMFQFKSRFFFLMSRFLSQVDNFFYV